MTSLKKKTKSLFVENSQTREFKELNPYLLLLLRLLLLIYKCEKGKNSEMICYDTEITMMRTGYPYVLIHINVIGKVQVQYS